MQLFTTDQFELPLPAGHRFPMAKYRLLREAVVARGIVTAEALQPAPAADDEQLALAHCRGYIAKVVDGTLTRAEIRRIGFPWTPRMVERSRRSTGATLAAARAALAEGAGVNLAGGTHHAGRDFGEGYCVFNDTAVAALALQAAGAIERAIVIDCDVHQGNGTAEILADVPEVFTLSLHGAKNFPLRKTRSDLDVPLPDGTNDAEYLAALEYALRPALAASRPQLAFYLAGADVFAGDRLGRLALTQAGIAARDRFVLETLRQQGVPVAIAMAGGYAHDVADIVTIHARTIELAQEVFG